uniref:Uncharacterized protein n=1 Tax=Setaria italica TaxID=4555 RepID=K4AP40_SETIT
MKEAFIHPLIQNMLCSYKSLMKPSNVKLSR